MTLLLIITESSSPKVFTVGVSQPFGRYRAGFVNTTSHPPIIHSDQSISTIYICVHGDRNFSLGILDSRTEVVKVGFRRNTDDGIGLNPLVTIGSNWSQVTSQGIFNLSFQGGSYFSNRSASFWCDAVISENPGCDRSFKNSGRKKIFEV